MSEPQQSPGQTGQPYGAPGQPYGAPGQPYGAPMQPPGQPYGAPPQMSGSPAYGGAPYGGTAPGRPGNSLGRTAFIIALLAAGLGLAFRLFQPLFYMSGGFDASEVAQGIVTLLGVAGTAAAVVLAVIALRRPAPHLLAALALGIAGSTLVGTVVAWVSNFFYLYL